MGATQRLQLSDDTFLQHIYKQSFHVLVHQWWQRPITLLDRDCVSCVYAVLNQVCSAKILFIKADQQTPWSTLSAGPVAPSAVGGLNLCDSFVCSPLHGDFLFQGICNLHQAHFDNTIRAHGQAQVTLVHQSLLPDKAGPISGSALRVKVPSRPAGTSGSGKTKLTSRV